MKLFLKLYLFILAVSTQSFAQDVVPKAKTKEERKAERKKMTLEQKIESVVPVDVNLPKASVSLPGDNKISSIEDAKKFFNESLPDLANNAKAKGRKAKKAIKKAKEEIFDGKNYEKTPVEKRVFKRGSGSRLQYIEFYVLKEFEDPNPYHRLLTWYDSKTKKIVEAVARDKRTNTLLHGPYKEYRGENLMREGFYYKGVKDGRWVEYDKDFMLLNKETYKRGFFDESIITYHSSDSSKIDEVIPVIYGKQTGDYWRFFDSGVLAEEGRYDEGKKVGKWVEYYPTGNRRKKEIQHPRDIFDNSESYTIREYSPDGKLIYEHNSRK